MTIFNDRAEDIRRQSPPDLPLGGARGRGICCGGRSAFASVAKVESGSVGVLTLFGRVTGEVLPEGIHLINPFKNNNQMSIRTQEIKESASVPSSEGLVMNLDTSLIYHVNPDKAAEVYQKIGPNYVDGADRAEPAGRHSRSHRVAHRQCALYRRARDGGQADSRSAGHDTRTRADSRSKAFCCATSNCPPP